MIIIETQIFYIHIISQNSSIASHGFTVKTKHHVSFGFSSSYDRFLSGSFISGPSEYMIWFCWSLQHPHIYMSWLPLLPSTEPNTNIIPPPWGHSPKRTFFCFLLLSQYQFNTIVIFFQSLSLTLSRSHVTTFLLQQAQSSFWNLK